MSKIEKALRRARGEQKLALVPVTVPAAENNVERKAIAVSAGALREIESRRRSSEEIARMHETQRLSKDALDRYGIIYPEFAGDGTVQAFREVRTKILQKTRGRNCIVMISGITGGSGSTYVSINLAAAFAFDTGKTALLIDCNLRKPGLQRLFSEDRKLGLIDYLEDGEMDVSEIIHPVGIERLRVIPAGGNREIPGEYFASQKMKHVLEGVGQRYPDRFVIIDGPPMTESADTQMLAELCDYVLLVAPHAKVTGLQIRESAKAIDGKKLLGVVFNNEPCVPPLSWKDTLLSALERLSNIVRLRSKKQKASKT